MPTDAGRIVGLEIGGRLPWQRLTSTRGMTLDLRWSRWTWVVVCLHPGSCRHCDTYLAEVEGAAPDLAAWDARPVVLGDPADRAMADGPLVSVLDPEGDRRAALGLADDEVAVLVADRYGMTWYADRSRDHDLPAGDELLSRCRYLGIQCPECETLDSPVHGVWDTASATGTT